MFPLLALAAMAQQNQPNFNEVTIYNQGFGLVKEYRILDLKEGRQTVAIENVAALIQPNTVSFQSITDKGSINVEQNYQYDLISPEAILDKAVGQKIRFLRTLNNGAHEELTGTLMNAPTNVVNPGTDGSGSQTTYNGMVIKTNDGRVILNPVGEVEVESLPEGLISRPTLLWDLEAAKSGQNTVELRYVTSGMTWNADYVMTLDDVLGQTADLQGWVTLNNSSGATFKNTKLKLLAGDVNQVPKSFQTFGRTLNGRAVDQAAAPSFQEQSLFEYHLYTLQRPTTLNQHETKQVSLLEGHNVRVTKRVIVDSMQDMGRYYPSEGAVGTGDLSPQVRIEFENSKDNGLGMPLPQGTFKVYQKDSDGSVQLIGEDAIKHTPKDEKVSLVMGRSFDVVANRKRLEFHALGNDDWTETFEITLRNHKTVDQDVVLLERHYGDWKVTTTSDPFKKTDSNSMQYVVNVPANGSKVVKYTVETKW
ncbi:MAG TPA: DUF4139 domain-containing protein [Fimbriimonadaceae bacterium]|jgi:hypothetical protein